MISLRDMKKRIKSIENIEKITKAMKMVAAAKLKKAQNNVKKYRRYLQSLKNIITNIAFNSDSISLERYPIFNECSNKKHVCLILITSDKGLCGAFNTNIIRCAHKFICNKKKVYNKLSVINIGKKGYKFFKSIAQISINNIINPWNSDLLKLAENIATKCCEQYINKKIDNLWILNNYFKNPIIQEIKLQQILPIAKFKNIATKHSTNYIYEPSQEFLLNDLIPKYFNMYVFQSFLESLASEHAARMQAMENATKNARETFDLLNTQYNRARQANITKELMEIISGAEAIKK